MTTRIAGLLLLSLFLMNAGDLRAQQALIRAKMEECMVATAQGNFEKLADLTYPGVIKLLGGKEAMRKTCTKTYEMMKTQGFSFDSLSIGVMKPIVTTKRRQFAVVPCLLVMKSPTGRIFQKGTMLGISEDKGKSWTFVDGGDNPDRMLSLLFPDEKNLSKLLSLPPRPRPSFETNE